MESKFESEATAYAMEAEKKMIKPSFFKKMFGASYEEKLEQARDLYEKAANQFKLANNFKRAGECYEKCSEIETSIDGMPTNFIQDAIKCYKKSDPGKYIDMVDGVVFQLCSDGRISNAARMKKDQGEYFEQNCEFEEAVKCFESAGNLFDKDDQPSQANQVKLKAADLNLVTKIPDYETSIHIYDDVITHYLSKDILRSSAKTMMMKAILCFLAMDDSVGAQKSFDKYQMKDPAFGGSREGELLQTMIECRQENDSETFNSSIKEYNRITPFQKVETHLVKAISEKFDAGLDDQNLGDDLQLDEDGEVDLR